MSRQDAKISSMERGLRELEDEVNMLKSNGALSSEEREEEIKQMEVYRSHAKFMKNKVTRTHPHTPLVIVSQKMQEKEDSACCGITQLLYTLTGAALESGTGSVTAGATLTKTSQ